MDRTQALLQFFDDRVFFPNKFRLFLELPLQRMLRPLLSRPQLRETSAQAGHFRRERFQLGAPALQKLLFLMHLTFQSMEFGSEAPLQPLHGSIFCPQNLCFSFKLLLQTAIWEEPTSALLSRRHHLCSHLLQSNVPV